MSSIATAVCGVNIRTMNTSGGADRDDGLEQRLALRALALEVVGGDLVGEAGSGGAPGDGDGLRLDLVAGGLDGARPARRGRRPPGSTRTVARSVARLTLASSTPGVFLRNRSMRLTHEAQVIPSIGRTISIGRRRGSSTEPR